MKRTRVALLLSATRVATWARGHYEVSSDVPDDAFDELERIAG